jgi:FixJ family two-component response regulator
LPSNLAGAKTASGVTLIVTDKKKPLIAIVDDDESVCRALERLVRSLGMTAETYTGGADFMDQLEGLPGFHPDCVILDVQMPVMNGIEVQTRIRRAHRNIPVVFITAHDDRNAQERALAGGAVAFLRKPCNDALIIRTLETALERRRADNQPDSPAEGKKQS